MSGGGGETRKGQKGGGGEPLLAGGSIFHWGGLGCTTSQEGWGRWVYGLGNGGP